jgi:hypothetical protein
MRIPKNFGHPVQVADARHRAARAVAERCSQPLLQARQQIAREYPGLLHRELCRRW